MKTKGFLKKITLMLTALTLFFANLNNTLAQTSHSNTGNNSAANFATHQVNDDNSGIAAIETTSGISDPNSDLSIILATLTLTVGTILVATYRFKSRERDVL